MRDASDLRRRLPMPRVRAASARTNVGWRVGLDKSEGAVKDKNILAVPSTACFAREVEDQGSGNSR
jgi:hypothetical protein